VIVWRRLAEIVAEHGAASLVSVHAVKGSAPREAGARMIVRPDGAFHGTIGGGQLEWQALGWAREALREAGPARFIEQALGPDLGQCCGGRVTLLIETFGRERLDELRALAEAEGEGALSLDSRLQDGRVIRTRNPGPTPQAIGDREGWTESYGADSTPLLLFGAGHVGRALVLALAPLPFRVRWIDSRENAFPAHVPAIATPVLSRDPVAELSAAPPDSFALVTTHDHALDLDITAAALARPFPFVGLIGSLTKRARFEKRFAEIGLPPERVRSLVCPLGVEGIAGKDPAIIAASTVAQLLQVREKIAVPAAGTDDPRAGRASASPNRQ
jgi:xanthine dehydrogenase accessory factor